MAVKLKRMIGSCILPDREYGWPRQTRSLHAFPASRDSFPADGVETMVLPRI